MLKLLNKNRPLILNYLVLGFLSVKMCFTYLLGTLFVGDEKTIQWNPATTQVLQLRQYSQRTILSFFILVKITLLQCKFRTTQIHYNASLRRSPVCFFFNTNYSETPLQRQFWWPVKNWCYSEIGTVVRLFQQR